MDIREQNSTVVQTAEQSKPHTSAAPADASNNDRDDDDIEIISEVKTKPVIPDIKVGMNCYAVRHGDLWKKAIITAETTQTSQEKVPLGYYSCCL